MKAGGGAAHAQSVGWLAWRLPYCRQPAPMPFPIFSALRPTLHQILHPPNLPGWLILKHIIYISDIEYRAALVTASNQQLHACAFHKLKLPPLGSQACQFPSRYPARWRFCPYYKSDFEKKIIRKQSIAL